MKQSEIVKEYSVTSSVTSEINKNRTEIINSFSTLPKTSMRDRSTIYSKLIDELYEWFLLQRSNSVSISGPILLKG